MVVCRAVGFDLDGTLFDHRGSAWRALDVFITDLGGACTEELLSVWFTIEAQEFESWRTGQVSFVEQRRRRLRRFLPLIETPIPPEEVELDALFAAYLNAYRREWRVFPGTLDVLDELRESGVAIGVLTNGDSAQQRDKLATLHLVPRIDAVCISDEIGYTKPDPRAFHSLAAALGVEHADIVFIGDDELHDVTGARAAGMRAALVDPVDGPDRLRRAIQRAIGRVPHRGTRDD